MKPRVFVSSTYYDLKYLRERIEKFLKVYGFETVLFESNNVTYEHGKAIDSSVYKELEMCHMMILFVGGRYGTAVTSEKLSGEEKRKYDDEYVSITRKEFETASEKNLPIFIFIDKNVYSDYENYQKNILFFDKLKSLSSDDLSFQFAHVDSLNVFKFINNLLAKPIKTFETAEEIEDYLQSQFAGMFYLYLQSLQKQVDDRKILSSVEELNNVTKIMSEMLDSVGKKVLGEDNQEYLDVIEKQFDILVDYFAENVPNHVQFESLQHDSDKDEEISQFLSKAIYEIALSQPIVNEGEKGSEKAKSNRARNVKMREDLNDRVSIIYPFITITKFNGIILNRNFYENVMPFVRDTADFVDELQKKIADELFWKV